MSTVDRDAFETLVEKRRLNEEQKRAAAELILLNPDLLNTEYKDSRGLVSEAEAFAKDGNLLVAENRYATAAKLALYEGKPGEAKKHLEKCASFNSANKTTYEAALKNFELVSNSVMEFYRLRLGGPLKS